MVISIFYILDIQKKSRLFLMSSMTEDYYSHENKHQHHHAEQDAFDEKPQLLVNQVIDINVKK